jgi:hypothetical protein
MGSLDVAIMDSTAFSLLSRSNSKIDGNQITFGYIDFLPHPTTLAPVFANLDQEVDLMIGSFNFCVRSLGSARFSDPVKSGLSARDTTIMATPEASVGSSSEANSPISVKPTKGTAKELDEIMENLDLEESSGHQDSDFARKPSFLDFARSPSVRVDAVQPTACFFADFFVIFLRCATRLMGMQ